MTLDGNAGSATTGTEGQAEGSAATGEGDAATLLSRIRGLDAKVTDLTSQKAAADAAAAAAAARLADYEAGKVGNDEALRAQIALKDQELAQARRDAALASIEAKFPETFGVLGAAAVNLTADQLAANEARLTGPAEPGTPNTLSANPASRSGASGPKAIGDMTSAELRAHMASFSRGDMGLTD